MSVHQSVLYCIDPLKLLKYHLIPPDVLLAGAGIGSVTFYISLKLLLILSLFEFSEMSSLFYIYP